MATARDITTESLGDLGVLAPGESPTADDENNGLAKLNMLLDQWAAERLTIFTVTATDFTVVSGTRDYTVGAGGDVNVARPVFVDAVHVRDTAFTPSLEYPPLQRLSPENWSKVAIKDLTATLPQSFYYNPTFPLGALTLYPTPTMTTLTGVVYAPQAVAEFTSLSTLIYLPPGYRRMLVKNLAVELGPSYQRNVPPELILAASEAKTVVRVVNAPSMEMAFDAGLAGTHRSFYIRSGM